MIETRTAGQEGDAESGMPRSQRHARCVCGVLAVVLTAVGASAGAAGGRPARAHQTVPTASLRLLPAPMSQLPVGSRICADVSRSRVPRGYAFVGATVSWGDDAR